MIHPELERWIFAMPFGLGPLQELAYTGSVDVEASVTNPRNLGWFAAAKVSSLGIQMSFFGMAYAETSTVLYAGAIRSAFFGSTGLFTAFGVSSATVATAVSTAGVVGFVGWFAAAKVSSLGIQMSFFGMAYAETSTVLYAGAIRSAFFGSTGLFTAFGVSSATVATAVSTAGVVGFVGYGVVRAAQSSTTRSEAYARRNRRYYAAQRETTRVTRTGQRHEGGRRSE